MTSRIQRLLLFKAALLFIITSANMRLLAGHEEMEFAQKLLVSYIANKGYADREIDDLHRQIQDLIPSLESMAEQDESGEKMIQLEVSFGESFRVSGEMYVFSGKIRIYYTAEKKLKKVVMIYDRSNSRSVNYLVEKREFINETPGFSENSINTNDDIQVRYLESDGSGTGFQEKGKVKFSEIPQHFQKIELLRSYREYLRKSVRQMIRRKEAIASAESARIRYMVNIK